MPPADSARSALNTNDLRGKMLRIKVKDGDITPAEANKADLGAGGAYTIPAGNLFPLVGGQPQAKTRPEVYAMGFRNPFRIQVDENDVAYVSDYSPDSQTPQQFHGAAGTGRFEIVRHPANYGWPYCFKTDLPEYPWNVNLQVPMNLDNHQPVPAGRRRSRIDCDGADDVPNNDYWNLNGGPSVEPGLAPDPAPHRAGHLVLVPRQQRDRPARDAVLRRLRAERADRPAGAGLDDAVSAPVPGALHRTASARTGSRSTTYDPANPNPKKFPPYYDDSVILGEFTQDTLRELKLDSQNRVFKINSFLPCGAAARGRLAVHVRVRQPDGPAVGRGRRLLPAHLRRRLLQHQPGRRHVQVAVRQGHAGARWPCSRPTGPTARCR